MNEENKKELARLRTIIDKKINNIIIDYNNYDIYFYNSLINYIDLLIKLTVVNDHNYDTFRKDEIIQLIKTAIIKYKNNPPKHIGFYSIKNIIDHLNKKYPKLVDDKRANCLKNYFNISVDNMSIEFINGLVSYIYSYSETIPYDIANQIIKSYATNKSSKISKESIKASLISIAQNELYKNNIYDITVFFGYREEEKNKAFYSKNAKAICINKKSFDIVLESYNNLSAIYELLNIIFHEVEHAIQFNNIEDNEEISFNKILFIKESILKEKESTFYQDNYKNIFMEIYARIAGIISTCNYIKNVINIDYKKDDKVRENLENELKRLNDGMTKKTKEFKNQVFILDYFDYYIANCKKQELSYILNNNPILKFEYNQDGTKKTPSEIFTQIDTRLKEIDEQKNIDKTHKKANLYSYTQLFIKNSLASIIIDSDNISNLNLKDDLLKKIIFTSVDKLYKKEIDNNYEKLSTNNRK